MKYVFFLCLIACFPSYLFSQSKLLNEFEYVDQKTLGIPASETYSSSSIAAVIKKDFKTDGERVRAAYTWVTNNITYDNDSMYYINTDKDPAKKVTEALRRRKGVCENYAALFTDIVSKCGISSFVISGYTKQLGSITASGHSWCAVCINSEWLLCDPTWDEGFTGNAKYFLSSPEAFIEDHMPFDPLWQLLPEQVTHRQFYNGTIFFQKEKTRTNCDSAVNEFIKLDDLHKLEATAARMQLAGIANQLNENYYRYIKMQIGIIYEVRDMDMYNKAVADLNKASAAFNDFIAYRNSGFILQNLIL